MTDSPADAVPMTGRNAASARHLVGELRASATGADSARLDLLDRMLAEGTDETRLRRAFECIATADTHLRTLVRAGVLLESDSAVVEVRRAADLLLPLQPPY